MAAVKLAQTEDKSVLNTAKELGISPSSLRRWINEYDEYGEMRVEIGKILRELCNWKNVEIIQAEVAQIMFIC